MDHIHRDRDGKTRDRVNRIESSRQRDSGLKGMLRSAGDPTVAAKNLKKTFDKLPLPPGIKQVGEAGLYGLELGTKLGKSLGEKFV